jgi:hypothetical protein
MTPHERKHHFDMRYWCLKTGRGTVVACAAVRCGMDPWFRRRGLRYNFYRSGPSGYWEYASDTLDQPVRDFFGTDGSMRIFFNGVRRSVTDVLKEVKDHLKELKNDVSDPS